VEGASVIRAAVLTVNVHGLGPEAATVPEEELFGGLAHGRYAYRIGLSRLLDMLRRTGVPATFFWPVFEAERCRPLIERCLAEGHEIASHRNAFEDHATLGAHEAEILEAAHERLTAITRNPTNRLPLSDRYTVAGNDRHSRPARLPLRLQFRR
jgi:peptidoglycan/xylan/chitin deacetylase (PgdA/CDA1 family)